MAHQNERRKVITTWDLDDDARAVCRCGRIFTFNFETEAQTCGQCPEPTEDDEE